MFFSSCRTHVMDRGFGRAVRACLLMLSTICHQEDKPTSSNSFATIAVTLRMAMVGYEKSKSRVTNCLMLYKWYIKNGGCEEHINNRIRKCRQSYYGLSKCGIPANTQRFHNIAESCAELFWDKRCSNLVATFDQIYFVWQ